MAWPAIGKFRTPEEFRAYVETVDFSQWKPIGIVIHNTAEPNLRRWHEVPRERWMRNLESYYKGLGWNGGPHLFVDDGDDGIGEFNVINKRGTHSPSFNAQWIGIEHVGDYAKEDDDAGPGLRVKNNGIAAMAILCAKLGIDPLTHIKLHKEDPRTDHDCPGKDMAEDKAGTIQAVIEYMGHGGDHGPNWGHVVDPPAVAPGPTPPAPLIAFNLVSTTDGLNLRTSSSQGSKSIGLIAKNALLGEIGPPVMNGNTKWLHVRVEQPVDPMPEGWVSARFTTPFGTPMPGSTVAVMMPPAVEQDPIVFHVQGKMSTFGGPRDGGMDPIEGLAIFETSEEAQAHGAADFFMTAMEAGADGLGRRLRVEKLYIACRWNYHETTRHFLQDAVAHVSANGRTVVMRPMDWGPNENTGRVADMSPAGAEALGLSTDNTCEVVIYKSGK